MPNETHTGDGERAPQAHEIDTINEWSTRRIEALGEEGADESLYLSTVLESIRESADEDGKIDEETIRRIAANTSKMLRPEIGETPEDLAKRAMNYASEMLLTPGGNHELDATVTDEAESDAAPAEAEVETGEWETQEREYSTEPITDTKSYIQASRERFEEINPEGNYYEEVKDLALQFLFTYFENPQHSQKSINALIEQRVTEHLRAYYELEEDGSELEAEERTNFENAKNEIEEELRSIFIHEVEPANEVSEPTTEVLVDDSERAAEAIDDEDSGENVDAEGETGETPQTGFDTTEVDVSELVPKKLDGQNFAVRLPNGEVKKIVDYYGKLGDSRIAAFWIQGDKEPTSFYDLVTNGIEIVPGEETAEPAAEEAPEAPETEAQPEEEHFVKYEGEWRKVLSSDGNTLDVEGLGEVEMQTLFNAGAEWRTQKPESERADEEVATPEQESKRARRKKRRKREEDRGNPNSWADEEKTGRNPKRWRAVRDEKYRKPSDETFYDLYINGPGEEPAKFKRVPGTTGKNARIAQIDADGNFLGVDDEGFFTDTPPGISLAEIHEKRDDLKRRRQEAKAKGQKAPDDIEVKAVNTTRIKKDRQERDQRAAQQQ